MYEMASLRPPFKAGDYPGLSKKVTQGYYPPLPSRYSKDFHQVIGYMIRLNYQHRLSCDEILTSKIVVKQIAQLSKLDSNIAYAVNDNY